VKDDRRAPGVSGWVEARLAYRPETEVGLADGLPGLELGPLSTSIPILFDVGGESESLLPMIHP
jgi:hypothetical protein